MFYFIKFIYMAILLPPGIFIILFASLAVWSCRKQRSFGHILAILTLVLYLCSTAWVGNFMIRSLESRYLPPNDPTGDVIIMLGGGATLDTPNFGGTGNLSGSAANRLLTAAELYNQLHVPILVSGGRVFETTGREAEIAQAILLRLGVPADKIIIENQSINTTENARFCQAMLVTYGLKRPILVTSAFHMRRAVKQFEKVGVTVTAFPTDYQTNVYSKLEISQWWPNADALVNVSLAVKEYIGLLAVRWY